MKNKWSQDQNFKFHQFIEIFDEYVFTKENFRLGKLHSYMSKFIQTRTPQQCRSHQQKLFKKFKKGRNDRYKYLKAYFRSQLYGQKNVEIEYIVKQARKTLQNNKSLGELKDDMYESLKLIQKESKSKIPYNRREKRRKFNEEQLFDVLIPFQSKQDNELQQVQKQE